MNSAICKKTETAGVSPTPTLRDSFFLSRLHAFHTNSSLSGDVQSCFLSTTTVLTFFLSVSPRRLSGSAAASAEGDPVACTGTKCQRANLWRRRRRNGAHLSLDDRKLLLCPDEVEDERVRAREDEREEEAGAVEVEVALCGVVKRE